MNTKKLLQIGVPVAAILLAVLAGMFPTSIGITLTIGLIVVAALAAIVFPAIYLAKHPKSGIRIGISVAVLVLIVLAAFAMSQGTEIFGYKEGQRQLLADGPLSKRVGAGVYTLLGMMALAFVVFIAGEVRALFK